MKTSLLEHLVCPSCKSTLECNVLETDDTFDWTDIIAGQLTCVNCNKQYPILGGVPRFLPEGLPKDVHATVDGFGYEWKSFDSLIQDTYMTDKANFLDFIYPVTEFFFQAKVVLDAGCGMGRFLKLGAEFGSCEIIGVDLSESVDVAYRHTRHLPNAHIVQADIMALPFLNKFDYIFSVGVLQFLQEPWLGFSKLVDLLKENGSISVWVYSRENNGWAIWFVSPLREYITSRLPRPFLFRLSHILGFLLHLCLRLVYRPANESSLGKMLRLPKLLPYNEYLYYTSRLSYTSIASIIFDHLVPRLTAYVSRKELEDWMQKKNLSNLEITSRNNMSWRGLGTRLS